MCSQEDDPSQHDLAITPHDLGVDTPAAALRSAFPNLSMMPPEFWEDRIEDLALLGFVIVPLAVNLTTYELARQHDEIIHMLAKP